MNRMWMAVVGGVCLAVGTCWMLHPAAAADTPPAATVQPQGRIGTFEPREIALAYYRSGLHKEQMTQLSEDHKKAQLAGDKNLAKHIEAQLKLDQEAAHRQVFGSGPYDTLGEQLKSVLPAVARDQKVDAVVGTVYFTAAGVRVVDVTDAILDELKTDEKTRKMIQDIREQIRLGKYKPEEFKGEH